MNPEELLGRLRFGGLRGRAMIEDDVLFLECDWFDMLAAMLAGGVATSLGDSAERLRPARVIIDHNLKFAWRPGRHETTKKSVQGLSDKFWFHVFCAGMPASQYTQDNWFDEPEEFAHADQ